MSLINQRNRPLFLAEPVFMIAKDRTPPTPNAWQGRKSSVIHSFLVEKDQFFCNASAYVVLRGTNNVRFVKYVKRRTVRGASSSLLNLPDMPPTHRP